MASIVVHVVGDHTVLYTAGGVVVGAGVGLLGSWLQQRSKVGADRQRLQTRLEAEEKRLDKQLTHDRDMKERAALRDALDSALEAGRVAFISCVLAIEKGTFGEAPYDAQPIVLAGSRLLIRLGREHPVMQRYLEARDALGDLHKSIARRQPLSRRTARAAEFTPKLNLAEAAIKAFVDAAATLVGSPFAGFGEVAGSPRGG